MVSKDEPEEGCRYFACWSEKKEQKTRTHPRTNERCGLLKGAGLPILNRKHPIFYNSPKSIVTSNVDSPWTIEGIIGLVISLHDGGNVGQFGFAINMGNSQDEDIVLPPYLPSVFSYHLPEKTAFVCPYDSEYNTVPRKRTNPPLIFDPLLFIVIRK